MVRSGVLGGAGLELGAGLVGEGTLRCRLSAGVGNRAAKANRERRLVRHKTPRILLALVLRLLVNLLGYLKADHEKYNYR
jgi:hypothetical protein